MKRATLILAALVLLFGADQTSAISIDFSFSNAPTFGDIATGTFQVNDIGGGLYHATSGTLNVTGGSAAGAYSLYPGGPGVFFFPPGEPFGFSVDNVFYPFANPILDVWGLALQNIASPNISLNIWGNSPGNYSFWTYNSLTNSYVVMHDSAATATALVSPEPGTLLLLGAGLTGLAGTARRRHRRA